MAKQNSKDNSALDTYSVDLWEEITKRIPDIKEKISGCKGSSDNEKIIDYTINNIHKENTEAAILLLQYANNIPESKKHVDFIYKAKEKYFRDNLSTALKLADSYIETKPQIAIATSNLVYYWSLVSKEEDISNPDIIWEKAYRHYHKSGSQLTQAEEGANGCVKILSKLINSYRNIDNDILIRAVRTLDNNNADNISPENVYNYDKLIIEIAKSNKNKNPQFSYDLVKPLDGHSQLGKTGSLYRNGNEKHKEVIGQIIDLYTDIADKNSKDDPELAKNILISLILRHKKPGHVNYECDIDKIIEILQDIQKTKPQYVIDALQFHHYTKVDADKKLLNMYIKSIRENPELQIDDVTEYYGILRNAFNEHDKSIARNNFSSLLPEITDIYKELKPDLADRFAIVGTICCSEEGKKKCSDFLVKKYENNTDILKEKLQAGLTEAYNLCIFGNASEAEQLYNEIMEAVQIAQDGKGETVKGTKIKQHTKKPGIKPGKKK